MAVDVGADLRESNPGEHGNWLGGHRDGFAGAAAPFPSQADRRRRIRVELWGSTGSYLSAEIWSNCCVRPESRLFVPISTLEHIF